MPQDQEGKSRAVSGGVEDVVDHLEGGFAFE
jgi:hypothetical protein